jgi:hypothetical protein
VDRIEFSRERIEQLGAKLRPLESLLRDERLCIYATGSYGRLEAWKDSDIDVFFLYDGHPRTRPFSKLTLIRVSACLIRVTEQMEFPEFSGDGRWLDLHYLERMEEVLGSPEDDGLNAFTARMLLLLESRPVFGAGHYERILRAVVDFYYRDFDDHQENFSPTFLVNDILRFWRTLTLNYEHDRYELLQLSEKAQAEPKAKLALKNYKLKMSRLATCFSMVLHLASERPPVTATRVLKLCSMTPRARFEALSDSGEEAASCVAKLLSYYDSFLDDVQRPQAELLVDFRDERTRANRLEGASHFGEEIFDLLQLLVPPERFRHLVV